MAIEAELHRDIVAHAPFLHVRRTVEQVTAEGATSFCKGKPPFGDIAPDGLCIYWNWDGKSVTVRNDRYGFSPVFYFASANEFIVSNSIPKLLTLGADPAPDDPALNVFLHLGWFLREETPFRYIRALPPAATMTWSPGVAEPAIQSSRLPYRKASISREDAIDGYIELFRKALGRCLPKTATFGLPISGGRDSRHILLELIRQGCKPTDVVTTEFYPPRRNTDSAPARALAEFCGVRHTLLQPGPRFAAEAETILRTSFCADEHSWMIGVCHFMGERLGTTYDGIIGDVLTQSPFLRRDWLDLYRGERWEALLDSMLDYYEKLGGYGVVLDPAVKGRFPTELARARILEELKKYADHDDPLDGFVLWNRSKREVSHMPFSMFAAYTEVETPYLDRELFDFLYSLPVATYYDESGNRNHLHTDVIAKAFPEAESIPYSDGNWTKRRIVSRHHWMYARQLGAYLRATPHRFLDDRLVGKMVATSMLTGTRIISHYGPMMQYLTHLNEWSGRAVFG